MQEGNKSMNKQTKPKSINRREFIKLSGSSVAVLAGGISAKDAFGLLRKRKPKPKNILLIITDQQHIDTIAAGGCRHVRTPALDWLKRRGISFTQSYSSNPLCSPARSSIFTGRTSSEAGVHVNGRPIRRDIPNLGQWFYQETDYETVYAGKWHLPRSFTKNIPGFRVINTGIGGLGYLCDTVTSRACEAFLRNHSKSRSFLMVASFLQPHDICEWLRLNTNDPGRLRYEELADKLPELPDNFQFDRNEPQAIKNTRQAREPFINGYWGKQHWRYYLWSYYRHIEFVDAEIGRILQALENSGQAKDTLIVFTSDHGEGLAHHQMVRKNTLYDESAKVSLIFSWPGHIPEDRTDSSNLVCGLDVMPTLCDYVGINTPKMMRGRSIRPILEGKRVTGRDFVVTEVGANKGRMVRTKQYKYSTYNDKSIEQLFDMKTDSGETKNLATSSRYASTLAEHRKLLGKWETQLEIAPNVPNTNAWWYKA